MKISDIHTSYIGNMAYGGRQSVQADSKPSELATQINHHSTQVGHAFMEVYTNTEVMKFQMHLMETYMMNMMVDLGQAHKLIEYIKTRDKAHVR